MNELLRFIYDVALSCVGWILIGVNNNLVYGDKSYKLKSEAMSK